MVDMRDDGEIADMFKVCHIWGYGRGMMGGQWPAHRSHGQGAILRQVSAGFMVTITTQDEFEAWLENQSDQMHYAIGSRAALRVFPAVFTPLYDTNIEFEAKDQLALLAARAIITSAVAATMPTADMDIKRTLSTASSAVLLAASAAGPISALSAGLSVARSAGLSADSFAADSVIHFASYFTTDSVAYSDASFSPAEMLVLPLWQGADIPAHIAQQWQDFKQSGVGSGPTWAFWSEWYQGFLDGKPLDWELQRRVALIPDEDWEKGAAHIAGVIEGIRAQFDRTVGGIEPRPPTPKETQAIATRVKANSIALVFSIAGVLEQIGQFREDVRGKNNLDPEYREDLLEFLDRLSTQLNNLMCDLPKQNEEISDEKANKLAVWWQEFRPLVAKKSRAYISPNNVSDATVPSGIILACTGIGAMIGGPAGAGVGVLAGGLITGYVKPSKAMDELMKPLDSQNTD